MTGTWLFFSVVLCAVLRICAAEPEGTVRTEFLNVRSGAGCEHRVIGRLCAGDRVRILSGAHDVWCRIAMPDSASVWIAASMLDSCDIPLSGAVLRSGPGASYEKIADAVPEKVVIRGRDK